jgi:hypothetical protein
MLLMLLAASAFTFNVAVDLPLAAAESIGDSPHGAHLQSSHHQSSAPAEVAHMVAHAHAGGTAHVHLAGDTRHDHAPAAPDHDHQCGTGCGMACCIVCLPTALDVCLTLSGGRNIFTVELSGSLYGADPSGLRRPPRPGIA